MKEKVVWYNLKKPRFPGETSSDGLLISDAVKVEYK